MTYILGLIFIVAAQVTLHFAGVSISDWKWWVITVCFLFGALCLGDSEKEGGK